MAQQFGIPPESIAALTYTGPDVEILPVTEASRDPTVNDKQYAIDTFWRNDVTRDLWFLSGFDITGALWVKFLTSATAGIQQITVPAGASPVLPLAGNVNFTSSGGTITITGSPNTVNFDITSGGAPIDKVAVDASTGPGTNPVLPNGGGQITVTGGQIAASSTANVIRTDSLAANTYTIEIQRSTTAAAGNMAKNGVSHFDSAIFTVGGDGFVSLVGGAVPPTQKFAVDTNTAPGTNPVVPTAGGVVTVTGAQVASGTVGTNVIRTDSLAANTFTIQIQRATVAAVSTVADNGVSHYDSGIFTIDGNGFVSLAGGSVPPLQKFAVQANTPPGTNPVVPSALGVVTVNGAAVANHSVPVETRSRAANAYNVEVQYATSAAATDATKSGLSHFNSAQFSVDANGFVALAGGASLTAVNVDTSSAPGTNPVVPNGSGQITVTGAQVATGTIGTNVIRTDSKAANTYTIEIQRSTAVPVSDVTKNGVAHFDSASFAVDANGFVTAVSVPVITWQDKGVSFAASGGNGYFSTAAITATLPAAGSSIGTTIEFIATVAGAYRIQPSTSDKIRIGSSLSTSGTGGGYIESTAIGDSITLVYQLSTGIWQALSNNGNWTIV